MSVCLGGGIRVETRNRDEVEDDPTKDKPEELRRLSKKLKPKKKCTST